MFPQDTWNVIGKLLKDNLLEHNNYLDQQPSAPTQLLSMLQVDLTSIEDIYNSCKTTVMSSINLLHTDPSFDGQSQSHIHHRRSLLPFLGDALRGLTGTVTTKDVNSIKTWIYQLITTRNLSTSYIYTKHHQICYPSQ